MKQPQLIKTNSRLEFDWSRLTLWHRFDYNPFKSGGMTVLAGGSDRVFTLWPKFIWWKIRDFVGGCV